MESARGTSQVAKELGVNKPGAEQARGRTGKGAKKLWSGNLQLRRDRRNSNTVFNKI